MTEMELRAWDKQAQEMFYPEYLLQDEKDGLLVHTSDARNERYILMQSAGLRDKKGQKIFKGDIYIGSKIWLSGDGYLKKKYPKKINVMCVVVFERGSLEGKLIGPVKEHREAYENNNYRGIGYLLEPMWKGSRAFNKETGEWDIEGDDVTCRNVEVIGNIYENPELLEASISNKEAPANGS